MGGGHGTGQVQRSGGNSFFPGDHVMPLGLQGKEVIKADVDGFLTYFEPGKNHPENPHVMVPLQGWYKGEIGERWHLLPIVWRTRLGIDVGVWAGWMKEILLEKGCVHRFIFVHGWGKQAKVALFELRFFKQLNFVWARHPDLFSPNVHIEGDYGMSRSG
jgi:hypothetical protein